MTVRYGEVTALDGVSFAVESGERVALVGSSGAGKTTVLDLAAGLAQPTGGSVRVLGAELDQLRGRQVRDHRRRIGTVSQHLDMALPLRVIHNVNAGRLGRWGTTAALWSLVVPSHRSEAAAALERVGLAPRLFARTDALSGGERQRVAVARVIRQSPELVLADEPTSSVDPRLADDVMDVLCAPADEATWTAIVSMHDPALARRHATRIVGLRHGRVEFDLPAGVVTDGQLVDLYQSD